MTPGYQSKILLRLIGIVLGGLELGFVVTKGLLVPIGHWYEMNKAQSESDLTQAFAIALAIQVLCLVAGGLAWRLVGSQMAEETSRSAIAVLALRLLWGLARRLPRRCQFPYVEWRPATPRPVGSFFRIAS